MADIGHGTTIGVSDGASGYNNIGNITSFSGPSLSTDVVEVTAMDSTDGYKEFIKGLKDWGEVSLSTVADPLASGDTTNNYDKLLAEANSGVAKEWKVTFPNGTSLVFNALLTGFSVTANPGDAISTDITLKVTGGITWANGS